MSDKVQEKEGPWWREHAAKMVVGIVVAVAGALAAALFGAAFQQGDGGEAAGGKDRVDTASQSALDPSSPEPGYLSPDTAPSESSFEGKVNATPGVEEDPTVGVWSKPAQNSGPGADSSSELVATVMHGEELMALCQIRGMTIRNGAGYDSAAWLLVSVNGRKGYLPNTWFARDQLPALRSCE